MKYKNAQELFDAIKSNRYKEEPDLELVYILQELGYGYYRGGFFDEWHKSGGSSKSDSEIMQFCEAKIYEWDNEVIDELPIFERQGEIILKVFQSARDKINLLMIEKIKDE